MTTVTFTSSGTWNAPAGVSSVLCQCWGEGGNGGTGITGGSSHSGGGGGGGEFASEPTLAVTASSNYPYTIGAGGSSTNTVFAGNSVTVTAHFGSSGSGTGHGVGGTGSTNSTHNDGGIGGNGIVTSNPAGGGGGGGAGSGGTGGGGGAGTGGGTGGSGGSAGTPDGGAGGKGGAGNVTGNPGASGTVPGGGGGGGSGRTGGTSGGSGASGQISLTYTALQTGTAVLAGVGTMTAFGAAAGMATLSGVGTLSAQRSGSGNATLPGVGTLTAKATQQTKASALTGVGTLSASGGPPTPAIVNQWANSYGQGTAFGSISSSLQSCVVPLNPTFSVGVGSGISSPGNWLFCIASWTQDPAISSAHVGISDDVHAWWRQYPASSSTGNVRTTIGYTPNIARETDYVYVAPDAAVAAICVLVVEVSGLQPWDFVTGPTSNYTSSGTSLALSLSAPAQASYWIGGIGGNNASSGQAFAPANYTTLATVTQSNGVDTTADNILTSAFRANSSASQSVSGTSSSSESMSGFMLGVYLAAASPIPASQNPNWPYTKFEAAFGAGFNTPNSELTWTDLTSRMWSWDETTGIQFQLGQLQSTNLAMEIDNFDGALTPVSNPWSFTATGTPSTHNFFTVTTAQAASISLADGFTDTLNPGTFFTVTSIGAPSGGNVNISFTPAASVIMGSTDVVSQASFVTGTPIRLRMALGTMGGSTINRWYVIQRNVQEWEEEVNSNYRRWCGVSGTDIWSAMSAIPPTFYRWEVYDDVPYAWWPMDDQPLEGGVLPTTLLNAAPNNMNVLEINPDPGGITAQDTYGFNGVDVTSTLTGGGGGFGAGTFFSGINLTTPPGGGIATYAVGTNSGWMYGDQPSTTSAISASGNPVEPSPGSASWQQSGLLGSGGSNGWYLICNDANFPGLSGGITLSGWFNVGLQGNGTGYAYVPLSGSFHDTSLNGQPFSSITICEIATASNPVAILQLDSNGHLNLITYNGGTGTSHSIYSASDLRNNTWMSVDITLTTTTWEVMLNGGLTADVSGSATGMTSAWTYLILCGDFGSSGGATPSSLVHGGNMSLSHWAVFPYILPDWRILSHYTAAISGFGLLPAPVGAGISPVSSPPVNLSSPVSPTPQASAAYQTTPDGQFFDGSYGDGPSSYSYSLVVTTNAGSYSSGPSARVTSSGIGQVINFSGSIYNSYGYALWLSWIGVAPSFSVYSSSAAAAEKLLESSVADGVAVTSGYGSGASPPTAATSLGDTVQQRIERLMHAGRTATPQRSIDPAPDLVQAPGASGGGLQAGSAVQAIQQSDQGLLFVDNVGNLVYWMRDHLASQYSKPVWTVGPNTSSGQIPYYPQYRLVNDPQRIFNVITVQPFSPSGAQLPLRTPSNATGVNASQARYGAQPLQITSWLQDVTVMQSQVDWLFSNFGQPQTRAEEIRIDAAPYPLAWNLFCGINVGDVILLEEWEVGGGGDQLILRVTEINRKFRFGGMDDGNHGEGTVVASVTLVCDFEPSSYF